MRTALAIAVVVACADNACADDGLHGNAGPQGPDRSYLYDDGAIPLFWMPLVGGYLLDREWSPRSTPLLFDPREGGARSASWEVPSWTVTATGAGVVALIGFTSGDPSRWHHAKGLAEALATSALVVSATKRVFGRHRPDWSSTTNDPIESESFPSGHATSAFAIATYSSLYLHGHVWRDEPPTLPHALAYAGIFAGALAVDGERIYHDRHFVTDVVAGSILGTATSALVYWFQEGWFQEGRFHDARASGHRTHDWAIAPSLEARASTFSLVGTL